MDILNQVLTNLPIRKTQATFLNLLCTLILAIPGRINYANLERFSQRTEKTFRNWAEKPIEFMMLEVWNEVLLTNLTSAMLVSRAVAPGMIARKRGKIVNICSLMSDLGRTTTGPYTAAKGGLKMLTRAMCADWAKDNLQINAIGPGYFSTEMTAPLVNDETFNAWVCSRTPAGRWGDPKELIGAAVFLCSSASNFVNGQIIYVDGGMLAVL
jgi:gluconate 5-dehydrogenase